MERCPSHSGVSEPVRDRGNFSRDERPPHWRLVAAAPLDRQQDPSPRLVLHDCGAAPSAAVAASTPSRFALIDERFAEKPEPINIYPSKRARKPGAEQVVLTKRDETQEKLIEIFGLPSQKHSI